MKLQTIVDVANIDFKIEPSSSVLVMGSCFAEHIGEKLSLLKNTLVNPFGVIYNPLSIASCINTLYNGRTFTADDLVFGDGLYHSFLHHGRFSMPTIDETLQAINRNPVTDFDVIILTLGTAYVYERNGVVVSNCHKFPERDFNRRLASVDECANALKSIAKLYPRSKIVVTVSPIRHLRDGLAANFLSKATLRLAIDELMATSPNAAYFPSYEILTDELRDYRFTTDDMCHPTAQAIQYIYDRFANAALTPLAAQIITDAQKAARQSAHRPLR